VYHSGDTMVVTPMGETQYHKADDEDIHTIVIEKQTITSVRTQFPFWKDADAFGLFM
jgi:omega-amidase